MIIMVVKSIQKQYDLSMKTTKDFSFRLLMKGDPSLIPPNITSIEASARIAHSPPSPPPTSYILMHILYSMMAMGSERKLSRAQGTI